MDILRLLLTLLILTLLAGCDNKSTDTHPKTSPVTQLKIKTKQGEHKQYWIQSYSTITKDEHVTWESNNTLGTELLIDYEVIKTQAKQIDLSVIAKHTELKVKGLTAYPDPIIQKVLSQGMQYQLNIDNNHPITIQTENTELQQEINNSPMLNSEYLYLQFVIAPPFIPTTMPLIEDHKVIINNFMGIKELSAQINKITDTNIEITLQNKSQPEKLYGKAIINRETGWIDKMALAKEAPVAGIPDYNMRTVVLMGPPNWSIMHQHQLIAEMNIKDAKQYTQPFPIFGFDKEDWQQNQKKEMATVTKKGKLFTLNTPDGAKQLMLVYDNKTGTTANTLGQYKVENMKVNGDKAPILLQTTNLVFNNLIGAEGINIATYKPIHFNATDLPFESTDIKTASADISFTPYQLETLTLPISSKKEQQIQTPNDDFMISITPTNQEKVYVLTWRASDKFNFGVGLINGANNALVQFIQPETVAWLTPSESRIIDSLGAGYKNRVQITFTNDIPKSLEILLLKQGKKAAYTYPVIFNRH